MWRAICFDNSMYLLFFYIIYRTHIQLFLLREENKDFSSKLISLSKNEGMMKS